MEERSRPTESKALEKHVYLLLLAAAQKVLHRDVTIEELKWLLAS